MNLRQFLIIFFLNVFLLSGCAFTTETMKLDNSYSQGQKTIDSSKKISIENLKDQRGCDPSLISNKGTIYKTSGKYIAEKEVSILFSDIIRDALSRQGYSVVSENSDYNLTGDIIKFDSNTLMGFWSGDIEAYIQTSLKLVDISNGNIVWAEIISGYGKREHILIDSLQFRKEAIDKAIYNYIEKLAASESFRKALQRQ